MRSLAELLDYLDCFDSLEFLDLPPLPRQKFSQLDAAEVVLDGISQQTQDLKPSWVFVALQGSRNHGLDFIDKAKAQGALVVLSDRPLENAVLPVLFIEDLAKKLADLASWFYRFPVKSLNLIGVTGTNGKTSVTNYLAQFLSNNSTRVGVVGTLGIGVYSKLEASPNTTPDVFKLQHHLAEFVAQKICWVVMEVSSHALALGRIAGLEFKAVALTQVSADHLDFHRDLAGYQAAKKLLFTSYLSDKKIVNLADDFAQGLVAENLADLSYGVVTGDLHTENIKFSASGISGTLVFNGRSLNFNAEVFGEFNLENILCATAVLLALGWDFNQDLVDKISQIKPVAGRVEQVISAKNQRVIIDYAHTKDALEKLLLAIKAHDFAGKIWLVFGCGGDRDLSKRFPMGEVAARLADRIILTSDNPRFEDPQEIIEQLEAGVVSQIKNPQNYAKVLERKMAIEQALTQADAEDLIIIAGKGNEDFQEVLGKKIPFSDLDVVRLWRQ